LPAADPCSSSGPILVLVPVLAGRTRVRHLFHDGQSQAHPIGRLEAVVLAGPGTGTRTALFPHPGCEMRGVKGGEEKKEKRERVKKGKRKEKEKKLLGDRVGSLRPLLRR